LVLAAPFVLLNGIPLTNSLRPLSNPFALLDTRHLVQWAILIHIAAASVVAVRLFSMDRFEAYLLFFVPLLAMALRFGLPGLTSSFLTVGVTHTAMTFFEFVPVEGSSIETTLLTALISTAIVATLVSEHGQLLNAVDRQARLMMEATEQDGDLKEVVKRLVREVEVAKRYLAENQDDPDRAGHRAVLAGSEEPKAPLDSHDPQTDRRPQVAAVAIAQHSKDAFIDPDTNLMWTRRDNRRHVDWSTAKNYATSRNIDGQTDWWLPTIAQLETLYDPQNVGAVSVKDPIELSDRFVWSCSVAGPASVWLFDFSDGRRKLANINDAKSRVLCVRATVEGGRSTP
jgi:hypothetical protein